MCFAPTAAADDPVYVNRFLAAYSALGVRNMVLTLWQGAAESVERLSQADIVVSGGGSAANLMALWKTHGVDHVIRRMIAADSDVVLAGVSAGAACWFSGCLTDAFGDLRAWRGGMGLLDGSFCPHFDGESERAPNLRPSGRQRGASWRIRGRRWGGGAFCRRNVRWGGR